MPWDFLESFLSRYKPLPLYLYLKASRRPLERTLDALKIIFLLFYPVYRYALPIFRILPFTVYCIHKKTCCILSLGVLWYRQLEKVNLVRQREVIERKRKQNGNPSSLKTKWPGNPQYLPSENSNAVMVSDFKKAPRQSDYELSTRSKHSLPCIEASLIAC